MHWSVMPRVVWHRNSLPIVVTLHNLNSVRHPILAYLSLALFVGCFPFSSCPICSLSPLPFPPSTFSISPLSLPLSPVLSLSSLTLQALSQLSLSYRNLYIALSTISFSCSFVILSIAEMSLHHLPVSRPSFISVFFPVPQFHYCTLVSPFSSISSSTNSITPVPPPLVPWSCPLQYSLTSKATSSLPHLVSCLHKLGLLDEVDLQLLLKLL